MAEQSLSLYDRESYGDVGFKKTYIASIVLHILVLIGIPTLSAFLTKPKEFERPKTFQLVTAPPLPPAPQRKIPTEVAPEPAPKPEVKPEPTPAPKEVKTPTPEPPKPKPKPQTSEEPAPPAPARKEEQVVKKVEENLDELTNLFSALPPVQVSVQGDFKFPWYINSVINKIQNEWKPPTEDRNIAVEVSFVINSDGTATHISVSKSSGNLTIDNLAIRAVTVASPFGKIPPGFSGDKIEIRSVIRPTRRSS